jgi:hypothetical protein
LSENLREHPQVFMTVPKELFFFNLLDKPEHFLYTSKDLAWYLEFFSPSVMKRAAHLAGIVAKQGRPYAIRARGEATASYAADTKEEIIDEMLLLNPELKVILMVRNPVQRSWSHAKKDLLNVSFRNQTERTMEEVPSEEMKSFMATPYL